MYHSFCRSGIWAWLSWVLNSRISPKLQKNVLQFSEVSIRVGSTSKLIYVVEGFGLKASVLCGMLAVGWRSLSVPCHADLSMGSSKHSSWLHQSKQTRTREREGMWVRWKSGFVIESCNCLSLHFFHTGKLLGLAHTHAEGITQGCKCQEVGMNGVILEVHLSHLVWNKMDRYMSWQWEISTKSWKAEDMGMNIEPHKWAIFAESILCLASVINCVSGTNSAAL